MLAFYLFKIFKELPLLSKGAQR